MTLQERTFPGTTDDLFGSSAGALDEMCRTIGVLVGTGEHPVRRVSMSLGRATVEVEWESVPVAAPAPQAAVAGPAVTAEEPAAEPSGHAVRSPLVGTFYVAPEPGARPFAAIGETVQEGQQIGIVEAMKLMNPVVADRIGRIEEVLVSDGEAVEYDQPLVVLSPLEQE